MVEIKNNLVNKKEMYQQKRCFKKTIEKEELNLKRESLIEERKGYLKAKSGRVGSKSIFFLKRMVPLSRKNVSWKSNQKKSKEMLCSKLEKTKKTKLFGKVLPKIAFFGVSSSFWLFGLDSDSKNLSFLVFEGLLTWSYLKYINKHQVAIALRFLFVAS